MGIPKELTSIVVSPVINSKFMTETKNFTIEYEQRTKERSPKSF